jgi:hypothetical protein
VIHGMQEGCGGGRPIHIKVTDAQHNRTCVPAAGQHGHIPRALRALLMHHTLLGSKVPGAVHLHN